MAEIKLNEGFTEEVDAFRTAGKSLIEMSVSSVSAEGLSLPTVDEYQERLYKIRGVIIRLINLTNKDAKDMDALAASLRAADTSGG